MSVGCGPRTWQRHLLQGSFVVSRVTAVHVRTSEDAKQGRDERLLRGGRRTTKVGRADCGVIEMTSKAP